MVAPWPTPLTAASSLSERNPTMDAPVFLPAPELVSSNAGLARCCATCCDAARIAFDTEFIRTDTFRPRIGLIQISDGVTVWLVDPLAVTDFTPLLDLLRNPSVVKVFHSCSEDLEVLRDAFAVLPTPLWDTQVAAAFAGLGFSRGYGKLVEAVLGVTLDKHETRSDWLQRPLSDAQCRYAAEDVWYLVKIHDQLLADLDPQRLEWIAEDMEELLAAAAQDDDLDRYYLRIKGAWRLDPADQYLLRRLARWREELARERNRPRGHIVPDAVLVEVVRLKPTSRGQLAAIEGFHGRSVRQFGELLLERLDQLLADGSEPPPGFETIAQPLDREARKLLSGLRQVIDSRAQALGLAPELLARKRDLEWLVRSTLAARPILPPALASGWRYRIIGEELLAHVRQQ